MLQPPSTPSSVADASSALASPPVWPNGDALDRKIGKLTGPAILNLLVLPLVGIVDAIWVGRMKNAQAIAGMQAGNQIFSSTFWIVSFLPTVVAPLIAAAAASGDNEKLEDELAQAMLLGLIVGAFGTAALLVKPRQALSLVVPVDSKVYKFAAPYVKFRALSFIPAVLSTIGFAAYRGKLDVVTPLKISLVTQLINVVLDPILIFRMGLGVAGASLATGIAELLSGLTYLALLTKQGVLKVSKILRVPSWRRLRPLLVGGFAIQLRALALNAAFLSVTRRAQSLDATGTMAAAHAITIQLWQLGGVFLFGLSGVASVLVPSELNDSGRDKSSKDHSNKSSKDSSGSAMSGVPAGRRIAARGLANRLLAWGLVAGIALGFAQLGALPLLSLFSPLADVQAAARVPSIIGAILQSINGMVFVGEGIMQGTRSFLRLAAGNAVATAGMLLALRTWAKPIAEGGFGLNGVWASFFVFNGIRLVAVAQYHLRDGPLAPRSIAAAAAAEGGSEE